MKELKKFNVRIGIAIMKPNDWWLTVYADSLDEAVTIIKKSTQRSFIVKEGDDSYHNALSTLLGDILDVPLEELLMNNKAEIKEFDMYPGGYLTFEDWDFVGYEKNKGVYAAGLRLFGKYPLKKDL